MYIRLADNTAFWFSTEAESLHAAEGILYGAPLSIYKALGDMDAFRRKYRLSSEINASFVDTLHGASVFECLEGFDMSHFTLATFREYILSLDTLPYLLLGGHAAPPEDWDEKNIFTNYLGAAAFFSHTKKYIGEVFTLAEELRTHVFYDMLKRYESRVNDALAETRSGLDMLDPLKYSDKLLHKSMYRRGPYNFFTFSPSLFLRYRCVRYIGDEQTLFFSLRDAALDNEQTLAQLKALADNNRFKIIAMIKEHRHIQGTDIARSLDLSAATVSHHIRVLREAGLLHEEQDGPARIYSLPTDTAEKLCDGLKKIL